MQKIPKIVGGNMGVVAASFSYSSERKISSRMKKAVSTKGFSLRMENDEKSTAFLLDTFSHHLLQAGIILLQTENSLLLFNLLDGGFYRQEQKNNWRFATDLLQGEVASTLLNISRLRAFLPLAEVEFFTERGALLDDEEKTLARFYQIVVHHKQRVLTMGVTKALRGYDIEHSTLVSLLQITGAEEAVHLRQDTLYKKLAITQSSYRSKPSLSIEATMPAQKSAMMIMKTFLTVARENENGIIKDIDSEFLHDYRVSLRKIRSLLSLFKGVFSKEQTLFLKQQFAELMRPTNRLRDLDVYLLEKENYLTMVPQSTHAGLEILFDYLTKERSTALNVVCKTIKSKAYKKEIEALQKKISNKKWLGVTQSSRLTSITLASTLIQKRYRQVCRIAATIDENTEDAKVHNLRISCKKLRYLMEFFTPFFPEKEIKFLIKKLKRLQDNLGKFNDYSVQQDFLHHIVQHELEEFGEEAFPVSEAIGALTAMLYRLQRKERRRVVQSFSRFDSAETRAAFTQLFAA